MSRLLDIANDFKARLLAGEMSAQAEMAHAYQGVIDRFHTRLKALYDAREQAEKQGKAVGVGWLHREQRLQTLLQQAEEEYLRFSRRASGIVQTGQQLAFDFAGQAAQMSIGTAFNRLPTGAVTQFVGAASDGSPLSELFISHWSGAASEVKNIITAGIAGGLNPNVVARQINKVFDTGRTRAQAVTRTEILRAHRESTRANYQENADVVSGWIWVASLSRRTCAACLAMHGTKHPLDEPMASHVCCRCTSIPVLADEEMDTLETGEDWFAKQNAEMQQDILGEKGAAAYRAGEVGLSDFVGVQKSDRWGNSVYQVGLEAAKQKAILQNA